MNTPAVTVPTPAPAARKPSLLFIDDERAILTAVRVVFRTGYDVTVTTDGFEAIELLKTRRFDVIVSDQRMPTITGVEVLKQARDISPDTVRILLTGYSDTDAILGAINDVEVHRFLQKPWDNEKLRRTIEEAVELARTLGGESPALTNGAPAHDASSHPAPPSGENPSRPSPEATAGASTPAPHKELLLVVDPDTGLYKDVACALADKVQVERAGTLDDVFRALSSMPVSIMLISFDVQNESDRTFIHMLKRQYPFILVIAACDSTDTARLIELINHMKIFRYVRRPVSMKMLAHYVSSAVRLHAETRANSKLLLRQMPLAMPDAVAAATASITASLAQRFAKVHQGLWSRFSAWLGAA